MIAQVPDGTAADTQKAVAAAKAAFEGWAATPLSKRKELVTKASPSPPPHNARTARTKKAHAHTDVGNGGNGGGT